MLEERSKCLKRWLLPRTKQLTDAEFIEYTAHYVKKVTKTGDCNHCADQVLRRITKA